PHRQTHSNRAYRFRTRNKTQPHDLEQIRHGPSLARRSCTILARRRDHVTTPAARARRADHPGGSAQVKAIIIGAGRGSRLKAMTDNQPKCYATVGGRKILDWTLEAFDRAGLENDKVFI